VCFYVVLSCVRRGLCDELITRPKESYPVHNDIRKPSKVDVIPRSGLERHRKRKYAYCLFNDAVSSADCIESDDKSNKPLETEAPMDNI
jgi:hypothetical protein